MQESINIRFLGQPDIKCGSGLFAKDAVYTSLLALDSNPAVKPMANSPKPAPVVPHFSSVESYNITKSKRSISNWQYF